MNLLSYNLECPFFGIGRYEERIDTFIETLVVQNFTILLLQEIFTFSVIGLDIFSKSSYIENKLQNIGYNHFLKSSPNWIFQNSGLFIASKIPIFQIDEITYPHHEREEYFTRKGAIIFRKGDITFVNTHLHCMNQLPKFSLIRRQQLLQIKETLLKHNITKNIVLAGDLNIDCRDKTELDDYNFLINLFPNGKDVLKPPFLVTSPPDGRLDYIIYYGKNYSFISSGILDANGKIVVSDHLGIFGVLFPNNLNHTKS